MKLYPIKDSIEEAAELGLREGARDVLRDAKTRVPVDDGGLRKSGAFSQDGLNVIVSFNAPHAWLQHEKTEYEHPNGGQAKYLENAALESDIAQPIADHVRARLSG